MYRLERAHKCKITFGVLAVVFFLCCILGYMSGGDELIQYGFMNTPLASIIMVVSLFAAIICFTACLTVNAMEKDIAEWLEILEAKANSKT